MKKTRISVGIPAFNEEANISALINSLLAQKGENFSLKEIIVVSDQSTDNTESIVKSIKDSRVKLVVNKQRMGQALGQNKIIDLYRGDILVFLNADVIPKNLSLLKYLVKPFSNHDNVGIVGGKVEAMEVQTFIEKILNYSHNLKQEIYEQMGNKNNLYLCHGRVRAFSRNFISKFKWKPTYGEDAFSFLSCRKLGLDFYYQPSAIILFRSPQTLKDHFKQSVRFFNADKELDKLFEPDFIEEAYKIPPNVFLKSLIKFFLKNPLLMSGYLLIATIAKLKSINANVSHVWDTSQSSKVLTQHKIYK